MAVLAVWTLLLLTPVPVPAAAPVSAPALSAPGVVVRLGNASLEEYTHGDPLNRRTLRGSNSAP